MKRENLAYLAGGLAFGFVVGYGVFHAIAHRPDPGHGASASGSIPSPAGPRAPTQGGPPVGATSGSPMVEEINALKRLLQAEPDNVRALVRLGNLYQDASLWKQAVGFYESALNLTPGDPNLLTDLGVCYQGLREYERALDSFRRAQSANPQHWQSLYNTAVVAGFDLKRYGEADEALRKLEALRGPSPELDQLREALLQARTRGGS